MMFVLSFNLRGFRIYLNSLVLNFLPGVNLSYIFGEYILNKLLFGEVMNSSIQRYGMFFGAVLVVSAISLSTIFSADTIRLKKEVIPTFQAIDLKIDAREVDYSGTVSIDLAVLNPTNEFIFHAEDHFLAPFCFLKSIKSIFTESLGRLALKTESERSGLRFQFENIAWY